MSRLSLATLARVLGLAAALTALAAPAAKADQFPVDSGAIWAWIFNQTNAYRASRGLPRLSFAPSIKDVAQPYAVYQASTGTSGHQADGRTPGQRLDAAGIKYCGYAENVFEIWSAPPHRLGGLPRRQQWSSGRAHQGHNANLLSASMTSMGVGSAGWTYENGRNFYKIVQLFVDDCGGAGPRTKTLGKRRN